MSVLMHKWLLETNASRTREHLANSKLTTNIVLKRVLCGAWRKSQLCDKLAVSKSNVYKGKNTLRAARKKTYKHTQRKKKTWWHIFRHPMTLGETNKIMRKRIRKCVISKWGLSESPIFKNKKKKMTKEYGKKNKNGTCSLFQMWQTMDDY